MPVPGSGACSSPGRLPIVWTFWKPASCQSIPWLTNAVKRVSDDKGCLKVMGSFDRGLRRSNTARAGTSLPSKSSSSSTGVSPKRCACTRTTRKSATASWKRKSEHVSSGEAARRSLRRTQASPGRLRAGQLHASFLEHCPALRQQLRILSFPYRQVGAGIDDGERAIANVGLQSTKLRLCHREGDQRDAIGLRQIRLEFFKR